ncbi:hypothetical protein [Allosphingosinicella vermicomposti]|uniref:hypothetical protein n=1 Tax=Allosphingosinicella vermicomposti TaxID=614671 RepID=UPI000D102BB1|nr:hypothetical protein [Allosphingosinicella vermicomposti]
MSNKALIAASALALIALAGCERQSASNAAEVNTTNQATDVSAQGPSDPEIVQGLSGRTARVTLADGRVIDVVHNMDGTARMTDSAGLDKTGRWSVTNGQLCFDWPGQPRECWPYGGPLTPGKTVKSTSDRGQMISTTLMEPNAPEQTGNSATAAQ